MVGTDSVEVDRLLTDGLLVCPACPGRLRPWGHARWRTTREAREVVRCRPRRGRCSVCGGTHVLLPCSVLLRRADGVAVIGAALLAKATGLGHRPIALALERPACTVRGWLRRFASRAESLRVVFTDRLYALDASAGPLAVIGSVLADAVEALGRAAAAASRRLDPVPPWQFASAVTRGLLLAPLSPLSWPPPAGSGVAVS